LVAAVVAFAGIAVMPARADGPVAPDAPLNLNGRHVFWANGVRTVANSDPSSLASNLIYHGGAIQKSPKVYLTFWGKEWTDSSNPSYTIPVKDPQGKPYTLARLQAYITKFMNGLGGTGWNNIQTQYCQGGQIGDLSCGAGTVAITNAKSLVAGVWTDGASADEPAPVIDTLGLAENVVTDPVATEALRASDHFGSTDPDATFFVFLPPGRVVTGSQPYGEYCGYHTQVTTTDGSGIRYANIPYILDTDLFAGPHVGSCGMNYVNKANTVFGNGIFDGFSIVVGHEYAEAVTDPDNMVDVQDGWNDAQTSENGDKCAWIDPGSGQGASQNLKLRTGTFAVQSMWSNAFDHGAGGCVVSYP
jgi:serine protease